METIADQLKDFRERRYEDARRKYSEILLRFNQPRDGDVTALDAAMTELQIDEHHLEADIRLIHQYRAYLDEDGQPHARGKHDAEEIRRTHGNLFIALNDKPAHGK